jgi:hypothetical protein
MRSQKAEPSDDRRYPSSNGAVVGGVPCREDDLEPARGLHWVAKLFRVLSGLLVTLMVVQLTLGLTSTIEISYGMLGAEAVRLLIFAGLLWGAGDLADLFVQSHHDLRASRILLARLNKQVSGIPGAGTTPPADDLISRGRGDATH